MKTKARRPRRPGCLDCQAAMINGLFCHETGCPSAWKTTTRACRECGTTFVPKRFSQQCCSRSCGNAFRGQA